MIATYNDKPSDCLILAEWTDRLGLPKGLAARGAPASLELLDHTWKHLEAALGRYPHPADQLRMLAVVGLAEDFLGGGYVDDWYHDDLYVPPFGVHYLHSSRPGVPNYWLVLLGEKIDTMASHGSPFELVWGDEAPLGHDDKAALSLDDKFVERFDHIIHLVYELTPGARTLFAARLCAALSPRDR